MTSAMPSSQSLEDLRPMSRGITIIPRSRSTSHTSSRDAQKRNSLKCNSASSVQSVADESLSLVDIENMLLQKVKDRKDDLKAAFHAFDQEGSATVTKGEFRRVIEGFLVPLTQSQFDGLFAKVPKRGNGTVPYKEFLQLYCKVSTASIRSMSCNRIPSGSGSQRSWPLGELQCRLKDKIGGNLKNITRAFRLFDYNRDGQIQQHELRRVLESYCFPLSHLEFRRLWSHYSPNNSQTISYKEFLEKLGVDCENYRKIAPDSEKLALNWDAANQTKARPRSRTSAWETQISLDEIHTMFLKKMSVNYPVVEKALQALDVADSGIVSYDDLKSVLSSFLFPINHSSFLGLLNRFGVNPAEPVQWRKFIALFREEEQMLPAVKDAGPAACKLSSIEEVLPKLREQILEVFPHLKRAFLVFDENRTGLVSRGDLRRLLESLTFTLTDEQFRGLTDLLHVPHSGSISYQHVLDFFQKEKPAVVVQEQISESTEKPEVQTQPTAESPSATAAWTVVEGVLKEQLSEHYASLMSSLSETDPIQCCTIPPEDLRKLLQQYGLPLSDSHFNKLCEPFMESGAVNYKLLLTSLGMSMRNDMTKSVNKGLSLIERNESAYQVNVESVKKQAVVNVVLKKLRDRLQMRGLTLQQCLMDTSRSSASVLDLRDFQKILDECRISLQAPQFQALIQTLGFFNGPISFSDFIDKYEGAIAKENNEKHHTISNNIKVNSFMSAEDCLNQLEARIKECHRDVLTAFRLMDRNRDGLVNYNDFRVLFNSLRFVTKEKEYHRLLELLGFKSGSTINYAEFYSKIRSDRKTGVNLITSMTADQLLDRACEQVHAYLVATAQTRGSELSKAFTQYGEDSESRITRNDLRHILYKYYLPITPREFEKIWARYDDEGKGYVTHTEFLNKVNITPHESPESPVGKTICRTASQNFLTETELHSLKECLKLSFEDVHQSLEELDKRGDGHVTAMDLLALLQTHGFQIEDHQLLGLIINLGLDVCKLSYHDFLDRILGPRVSRRSVMASPVSPYMMSSGDSVENLSPDRALQKVRELVTNSLDTLSKAFTAFDKTRNGKIAQAEFRRVLDHFCIKLSDVQYRHLLAKLSIKEEESKVDWKQFLHIFNLHNQETSEEWLEKINKVHLPNQTCLLPISDVLGRIQEVVSARIYTITKEMVDLDYAGVNTISKEDFRTICDHHFMRLTDEQFEALWKMLPINIFGNLDYREFLKKFSREPIDQGSTRGSPSPSPSERSPVALPQCPKTAPCSHGRSKSLAPEQLRPSSAVCGRSTLSNSEALERRLRAQIRSCWQEVQRRCREADTGSNGEIDVETFLGILEEFHISLTHSQFEQLSEKYNIRSKESLSYPEFLQHFVLMLKPQANTFTRRRKLHVPSTMSSGPLSKQCIDTLLRLCPSVQLYWRTMKQAFISCDKERTGKISLQDFRKVLRQYNINLSEEDVFHLTSFFDKNISGCISYNEFLSILQK
ncbi:EF-hand calcium-binding domain-containing protein 6 isoform X1 [Ictalurus punctatus]|uniref:EF-hand calcium-binding domain-containing protein 6 isoform X1 n=1 Tax=Ictalurus punctatus TaxID=7998 RepID=A0A2D0RJ54_ICTPU|nr:EF-hand calcium-binding domain-containing protein 6 isoform X1 [Ictalurus punctatus]